VKIMLGRLILPFTIGFLLGGLVISIVDDKRARLERAAPGPWVGHIYDVEASFIDDPELQ